MKIRDEKIEVICNGKTIQTLHLNRGCPVWVNYRENADYSKELAEGKTKQQARLEALERAAQTFFDSFWDTYKEIMAMDMEEAEAFLAACYESREAMKNEKAPPAKRARNARRTKEGIKRNAKQERERELSPEGRAIFDALEAASAALDKCAAEGGPDEIEQADRIMEEAEAPLDALALQDPEEATRIYARSSYFDEYISPHAVYLGQGVTVDRSELKELDTPEKRAAYIRDLDEAFIAARGPITIDSGEPVTLEGFTEPVIIG